MQHAAREVEACGMCGVCSKTEDNGRQLALAGT